LIEEAVSVLIRHPLIGRPVEYGLRELVISRGRSGYMALYSLEEAHDAVLILAIRHQREPGYWGRTRTELLGALAMQSDEWAILLEGGVDQLLTANSSRWRHCPKAVSHQISEDAIAVFA